jgi:hypothetical protein
MSYILTVGSVSIKVTRGGEAGTVNLIAISPSMFDLQQTINVKPGQPVNGIIDNIYTGFYYTFTITIPANILQLVPSA